jgi:CBS domain-containing protein
VITSSPIYYRSESKSYHNFLNISSKCGNNAFGRDSMKVKDIMTASVVQIGQNEPVAVAARTLAHYNIGALPVCDEKGRLCGIVTDRDIVTRCLAADMEPSKTQVKQVMTAAVKTIDTEADAAEAARVMGSNQIRRLPVIEDDKICGILSLGDLSQNDKAANALSRISRNCSDRN